MSRDENVATSHSKLRSNSKKGIRDGDDCFCATNSSALEGLLSRALISPAIRHFAAKFTDY